MGGRPGPRSGREERAADPPDQVDALAFRFVPVEHLATLRQALTHHRRQVGEELRMAPETGTVLARADLVDDRAFDRAYGGAPALAGQQRHLPDHGIFAHRVDAHVLAVLATQQDLHVPSATTNSDPPSWPWT